MNLADLLSTIVLAGYHPSLRHMWDSIWECTVHKSVPPGMIIPSGAFFAHGSANNSDPYLAAELAFARAQENMATAVNLPKVQALEDIIPINDLPQMPIIITRRFGGSA